MAKSKSQVKNQIEFIDTLVDRLKKDLNDKLSHFDSDDIYYGIAGRYSMQNDIVRIRRELIELSKMLDPYRH